MEAFESNHARYVTRKIAQHARSMTTRMRSLPTDSPIPYIQPIDRDYASEGSLEDIYATPYIDPSVLMGNIGGTDTETDRVSTFTGLDNYDTLFAARHGRGALDPIPNFGEQKSTINIPIPITGPELINPMEKMMPIPSNMHPDQREPVKLQITSPSSDIIGEDAAIFMDMTETILDILDKQVVVSPGSQQQVKKSSPKNEQEKMVQSKEPRVSAKKEHYPDLFLPVRENYRISDPFHGYSDSLSTDNNPMVLVELNNLFYKYGTSIYVVDRVNGTMYGKFSVGYRIIPEKATVIPQYQHTSVEEEYMPAYENTLPGIT